MCLSRRLAREAALRSLFQVELGRQTAQDAVEYNCRELAVPPEVFAYAQGLVAGALAHQSSIDTLIACHTVGWTLERLPGTDRAILRMAVYELQHLGAEVPASVVINEAVELARLYGDPSSARFVNGILATISRLELGMPEESSVAKPPSDPK